MFLKLVWAAIFFRERQFFKVVGLAAQQRFQVKVIHCSTASFLNTFIGVSCLFHAYFPSKCGKYLIKTQPCGLWLLGFSQATDIFLQQCDSIPTTYRPTKL